VEYSLPIINQVQINEKSGLSFASALRSMLRQNPDIIMIGEIRDTETAAIAVRASLTGHLVLSTIHTNDSVAAVTRLIDMGIELYLVASALETVLAQRLVRTICPECREQANPPKALLDHILPVPADSPPTFYRGAGCMKCRGTGYAGMTALYELFEVTDSIREAILNRRPEGVLRSEATQTGYRPLFETGLELALAGTTSLEEVLRVASPVQPSAELAVPQTVDKTS
jgi:type II secretory ATPase GspE/PulE/Tfp pilus assembly ATPase PilB-like protein